MQDKYEAFLMKKYIFILFTCLILSISGCASDYLITTKSGDYFVVPNTYHTNNKTGILSFIGKDGILYEINTKDISKIEKIKDPSKNDN